jgi:DNA-directed RNA polymerase specialized sigma24 family protein
MSRPASPLVPLVIRRVLEGFSTKEIAHEAQLTAGAVSKIIGNTPDIRKRYVTDAEFRQLLNQRKATP